VSVVLGIDPGSRKAGYAVVTDATSAPLALGIQPLEALIAQLGPLVKRFGIESVALGRGTNAAALHELIEPLGIPVHLIDETETTLRARSLYFSDNPPKGWRRLIPVTLQLPPRPIDDYAALLIARRFVGGQV
jgi:RNase H-fold protein (predicted Holliday junction resolvase)